MSVISSTTKLKVSSTLDKSTPRKSLIDRDPGTCWTSTQGLPQWIELTFAEPVVPEAIELTFQGGFVGTRVAVQVAIPGNEWRLLTSIYPEDVNRKQRFDISSSLDNAPITSMKLIFEESSDFFGRITIYDLDVFGKT
ncbi:SubName: Full=Uncharacterized protein {ECO:0000313/EMBL:CCA67125.1} [Serendipita indica DSM 11827]|uniref:F5/8 type C domain-containing protein n=1 Tax=Serendipita indica (strain DSM 11827) TaxID=1109443 RepID=G4T792_SERID|nr:SubName: Full=Uncharacterized protein {ECO:0000313/EMBL:CCA67125.1} [Serendipita indica DSM 11827]CCA67125.1 hypothetical protein PIIN_00959 [Serendipita indica DSM 11827]